MHYLDLCLLPVEGSRLWWFIVINKGKLIYRFYTLASFTFDTHAQVVTCWFTCYCLWQFGNWNWKEWHRNVGPQREHVEPISIQHMQDIAFVSLDIPNMPWDNCDICLDRNSKLGWWVTNGKMTSELFATRQGRLPGKKNQTGKIKLILYQDTLPSQATWSKDSSNEKVLITVIGFYVPSYTNKCDHMTTKKKEEVQSSIEWDC